MANSERDSTAAEPAAPAHALRRGLARARKCIDDTAAPSLLLDEPGTILHANAAFEALLGCTPGALDGLPFASLMPDGLCHRRLAGLNDAPPGVDAEARFPACLLKSADGRQVSADIEFKALLTPQVRYIVLTAAPVSEAEPALLPSTWYSGLEGFPAPALAIGSDGLILAANSAWNQWLGHRRDMLAGHPAIEVVAPEELRKRLSDAGLPLSEVGFAGLAALAAQMPGGAMPWTLLHAEGTRLPARLSMIPMHDDTGQARGWFLLAASADSRAETADQALAQCDPLTGLPNRALLFDRLDVALRQAERRGGRVALLLLDLDRFKSINDTFGHSVGDAVLVTVARRLSACVRKADTVARLGGDEFVLLFPEIDDRETLEPLLRTIIESISATVYVQH